MRDTRTKEELEGELRQLIMQETWLRNMVDERIEVLLDWRRDIEYIFKYNYPNETSTVPMLRDVEEK